MTAPRLEIAVDKIRDNAKTLVGSLSKRGISVTAVTKAALGSHTIASALLDAGVQALGDSRIENIESMRRAKISANMTLIRSPMLSQASRVVAQADVSFNTELDVIAKLSDCAAAAHVTHGVVLMVELGDLREGIMPEDLHDVVRQTLCLPSIAFKGIGSNLACRSGVAPDAQNMAKLSTLADSIDTTFGTAMDTVSGGNSANVSWAMSGASTGRINNLRLGESILLGREPLNRQAIAGLHTDAFTLVAEVIESKLKPTAPWGTIAQTAFGPSVATVDRGLVAQSILAIGHQDTAPNGLQPPQGIDIVGASSDHLIIEAGPNGLPIGTEVRFQLNYSALIRVMMSPFVEKDMLDLGRPAATNQFMH